MKVQNKFDIVLSILAAIAIVGLLTGLLWDYLLFIVRTR